MAIPKDFLWNTIEQLTVELERVDPNSVLAARCRGLLDARTMIPTATAQQKRNSKAERRVAMAAAYLSGKSLTDVGAEFDCNKGAVRTALERCGVALRSPHEGQKSYALRQDEERVDRIRAMRAEGKNLQEIAAVEHVTRERIRQICVKNHIGTGKVLTPDQRAAVAEYVRGDSLIEVAERHGVGTERLKNWVRSEGHLIRPTRRIQKATLTKAQRAAEMYTAGASTCRIADDLSCSQPTVYRFLAIAGVQPNRKVQRVAA